MLVVRFSFLMLIVAITSTGGCKQPTNSKGKKKAQLEKNQASKNGENSSSDSKKSSTAKYSERELADMSKYGKEFEKLWEGKTIHHASSIGIERCVEFSVKKGKCRYWSVEEPKEIFSGSCYITSSDNYIGVYCDTEEEGSQCDQRYVASLSYDIVINQFTKKKTVSGASNKVVMTDDDDTATFEVVPAAACGR